MRMRQQNPSEIDFGQQGSNPPLPPPRSHHQPTSQPPRLSDPSTRASASTVVSLQPSTPQTPPPRASGHPQYPDTPIPKMKAAYSPVSPLLARSSPKHITGSPALPQGYNVSRLPPAFAAHRSNMDKIRKEYESLRSLLLQFGCGDAPYLTQLLQERFPKFTFQSDAKVWELSHQLRQFNKDMERFVGPFKELLRFEKMVQLVYGDEVTSRHGELLQAEADLAVKLSETENLIYPTLQEAIRLRQNFERFAMDLASFVSGSKVTDINTAFSTYCQMNRKYTFGSRATKRYPGTFAGMGFEYKQLINNVREIKGTFWLDTVMEAYLKHLKFTATPGVKLSISIDALAQWILDSDNKFHAVSKQTQNAILEVREKIGCWQDLNLETKLNESGQLMYQGTLGKSLAVYLRFHCRLSNDILYPFVDDMQITPQMRQHLDRASNPANLAHWVTEVEANFHPTTGWKSQTPIHLKEMAVIIHAFELSNNNPALVERAKQMAADIVHYIYTAELSNDDQQ